MTDIVELLKIIHADANGDYDSSSVQPNASVVAGDTIAEILRLRAHERGLRKVAGGIGAQ